MGWKEREKMEKLEERYMKWVLGVDGRTPEYVIREELKREKLRGRAGKRAWDFERRKRDWKKRLEKGKKSALAKRCWGEMMERVGKGKAKSEWEGERRKFFEEKGIESEEAKERREKGDLEYGKIRKKDREMQEKEREEKIRGSR
nr:PREDICTED: DNA ligase 1-like [Linepithema humile]